MKKKFLRKVAASCAVAVALFASNTTIANAYSVTNTKGFTSGPWEVSVTSDSGKGILKYGYNTDWIDEDYAHAYHSTKKHYAYVKNARGSFSGSNKSKKNWSKIEVRHKGSKVTYGNSY